jgi:hypothetical protein
MKVTPFPVKNGERFDEVERLLPGGGESTNPIVTIIKHAVKLRRVIKVNAPVPGLGRKSRWKIARMTQLPATN